MTGRADSQSVLHHLERANLFLLPLDSRREWFRYHALFASLLRQRLLETDGAEAVQQLQRQAGQWFAEHGFGAEAVDYGLASGDHEWVAQLIEQQALSMLMRGELMTLLNWTRSVENLLPARPWLAVYRAWALTLTGQTDAAETQLCLVEGHALSIDQDGGAKHLLGHIAANRVYVAVLQGNVRRATELARQALEYLPESDQAVRSTVAGTLGPTCRLSGDLVEASRAFGEATRGGLAAGNLHLASGATCSQAALLLDLGQLHAAAEAYREALRLVTGPQGEPLPLAGRALVGLSRLDYAWGDLETASRHAQQGIEACRPCGSADTLAAGYVMLTRIRQAQGDVDGARAAMAEADKLARNHRLSPLWAGQVEARAASLSLAEGNIEAVAGWVRSTGITPGDDIVPLPLREPMFAMLANWLLAAGQPAEAERLALRLVARTGAGGQTGLLIEALLLQALVRRATGGPPTRSERFSSHAGPGRAGRVRKRVSG